MDSRFATIDKSPLLVAFRFKKLYQGEPEGFVNFMVRLQFSRTVQLINKTRDQHRHNGTVQIVETAKVACPTKIKGQLFESFPFCSLPR